MPAIRSTALNKEPIAPPATRPDAIVLPLEKRRSANSLSFVLFCTKYAIKPPISNGVLISIGKYVPRANANGGTFTIHKMIANNAPAIYRGH